MSLVQWLGERRRLFVEKIKHVQRVNPWPSRRQHEPCETLHSRAVAVHSMKSQAEMSCSLSAHLVLMQELCCFSQVGRLSVLQGYCRREALWHHALKTAQGVNADRIGRHISARGFLFPCERDLEYMMMTTNRFVSTCLESSYSNSLLVNRGSCIGLPKPLSAAVNHRLAHTSGRCESESGHTPAAAIAPASASSLKSKPTRRRRRRRGRRRRRTAGAVRDGGLRTPGHPPLPRTVRVPTPVAVTAARPRPWRRHAARYVGRPRRVVVGIPPVRAAARRSPVLLAPLGRRPPSRLVVGRPCRATGRGVPPSRRPPTRRGAPLGRLPFGGP